MDPEAIFFAIGFGRQFNGTATLQVLIEHGADVNHISKRWGTPLSHAVWQQQEQDLKVLLENGADPTIPGSAGASSALEIAKRRGRMDFYELMETTRVHSLP
jgi:ankyrin repeat protein